MPQNRCALLNEPEYHKAATAHCSLLTTRTIEILGRREVAPHGMAISISFDEIARDERVKLLEIDEITGFAQIIALGPPIMICQHLMGQGYTVGDLHSVTSAILSGRVNTEAFWGDAKAAAEAAKILNEWVGKYFARNDAEMGVHLAQVDARLLRVKFYPF